MCEDYFGDNETTILFPSFLSPKKSASHSLLFLNIAQFLSALNDNLYKLAFIFFAISLYGKEHTEKVFSIAGGVFVIPFLLFSSLTGIIADRFSKEKVLVAAKALEIGIMVLATFGFLLKSPLIGYSLLFLLAAQATLFSPAKYGIIPEIVKHGEVARANGLLTSCTYIAIITGTFFASLLTDLIPCKFSPDRPRLPCAGDNRIYRFPWNQNNRPCRRNEESPYFSS